MCVDANGRQMPVKKNKTKRRKEKKRYLILDVDVDGSGCGWWSQMGSGDCGWAEVVADGADACKKKKKEKKRTYQWFLNVDGCGCRWLWMQMDVVNMAGWHSWWLSTCTSEFGLRDFCASLCSHNTLLINLLLPNISVTVNTNQYYTFSFMSNSSPVLPLPANHD